jgi:hypothetical protein
MWAVAPKEIKLSLSYALVDYGEKVDLLSCGVLKCAHQQFIFSCKSAGEKKLFWA